MWTQNKNKSYSLRRHFSPFRKKKFTNIWIFSVKSVRNPWKESAEYGISSGTGDAGGTQEFLLKLKNSKLEDDMLLEEFYDKVHRAYDCAENYYIILIHAMYDVPGNLPTGSNVRRV